MTARRPKGPMTLKDGTVFDDETVDRLGPFVLSAAGDGALHLDGRPLGGSEEMQCRRLGGSTFTTSAHGGMPSAFDGDLLYLGPFAIPRVD